MAKDKKCSRSTLRTQRTQNYATKSVKKAKQINDDTRNSFTCVIGLPATQCLKCIFMISRNINLLQLKFLEFGLEVRTPSKAVAINAAAKQHDGR